MNTKDVFNYFKEFAAGSCEWIDDESCKFKYTEGIIHPIKKCFCDTIFFPQKSVIS
jgi:hypothetical protein